MIEPDQISRDLRIFSDPATHFDSHVGDSTLRIKMIRDSEREYYFDLRSGSVVARHDNERRYASLASLLASAEFIDVRKLRANQRRILTARFEKKDRPSEMLEPEGFFIDRDGTRSALSKKSFRAALTDTRSSTLAVLLIDGPAGIGKTSLLEAMAFERSDPASSLPPLLHVTSGGSRLTDLNKALAYSTQVLRSLVTFDQVPILTRLGVLQVAIDGFDELVDPEGYKDAWSALREFLGEVGVGGPIILSGRDTFFDQQRFEQLLASRISNLELRQARLTTVSPSNAKDFLVQNGWSAQEVGEADAARWFRPGSYQLRPFFLAQISGQDGWNQLQLSHGSPQSFLAARMIDREAKLVASTVGIDTATAESALWEFFGIIAEDMAIQESDTVDEAFIAFACESAFGGSVSQQDLAKLVHRAGSFALLESDGSTGGRRFPHSEFQNQFAAKVAIKLALASSASTTFLRQAVLSIGLAEAFADAFSSLKFEDSRTVRHNLEEMLRAEGYSERARSNIAVLLLSTLARRGAAPLTIASVAISEARLLGTLETAALSDVTFNHLDVTGCDCRAVVFSDCSASVLTVDKGSTFGETLPAVEQLHFTSEGQLSIIRIPHEITSWLTEKSVKDESPELDLPFVKYFDRLCRKFMRQHQIRDHHEDEAYYLLQDEFWPEARLILGARVSEQVKAAGGPKATFFMVDAPDKLLNPAADDDESRALRREIVKRARELASQ